MGVSMRLTKELLDQIAQKEDDAYRFFSQLAESTNDSTQQEIYNELAQEELEHRDFLKTITENAEYNLTSEEVVALSDSEFLNLKPIQLNSSIKNIYEFIVTKCTIANKFFKYLKESAQKDEIKSIYEKIANLELALKYRISDKIKDLK
jgi:rubrerythrin